MTDPKLPALPPLPPAASYRVLLANGEPCPAFGRWVSCGSWEGAAITPVLAPGSRYEYAYTGADMFAFARAYATAAVLADREARDAAGAEDAGRYENALDRIDHWLNRYDVGFDDAQSTLDRIRDEYEAAMGDDDAR